MKYLDQPQLRHLNDDTTLDAEAVAAMLHAECETVMQYARRGLLPGTRIGKSWVFMRDDVIAFLRKQIAVDTEARRLRSAAPLAVSVEPQPGRRRRAPPALPALPAVAPGNREKK